MSAVNPHAIEVRLLLDLVAYELHRLNLPSGAKIRVTAGRPDLTEDLHDRLWPDHDLVAEGEIEAEVHLLDVEQEKLRPAFAAPAAVVAFRNRTSHKALVHDDWQGVDPRTLLRTLRRTHDVQAFHGVMGPSVLARLALAGVADRVGRFDVGFQLADRARLLPVARGIERHVAPYGVISARRRS